MRLSEITNGQYEEMMENGLRHSDYIEHWGKANHKYISKKRGPSGKWIYKYYKNKSKKLERNAKKYRDEIYNVENYQNMPVWAETPNIKKDYENKPGRKLGLFTYRTINEYGDALQRSGRPSSYGWDSGSEGSKNTKTTKVNYSQVRSRINKKNQTTSNFNNRKASQAASAANKKANAKKKLAALKRSLKEERKYTNSSKKSNMTSTERFNERMKQKSANKKRFATYQRKKRAIK